MFLGGHEARLSSYLIAPYKHYYIYTIHYTIQYKNTYAWTPIERSVFYDNIRDIRLKYEVDTAGSDTRVPLCFSGEGVHLQEILLWC